MLLRPTKTQVVGLLSFDPGLILWQSANLILHDHILLFSAASSKPMNFSDSSLSLSLCLSLSLTHSRALSRTLTPTLTFTLTFSLTLTLTHSDSPSLTLTLSLSDFYSHSHSLALTLTDSLPRSLTHPLTHSLAHSLPRSLTHPPTRSLTIHHPPSPMDPNASRSLDFLLLHLQTSHTLFGSLAGRITSSNHPGCSFQCGSSGAVGHPLSRFPTCECSGSTLRGSVAAGLSPQARAHFLAAAKTCELGREG